MAPTQEQAARQRSAAFSALLDPASLLPGQTVVNLYSLRQLCLQGVPEEPPWLRAQAWKALLHYLPEEKRDWSSTLTARRDEYYQFVNDFLPMALLPRPPEPGRTFKSENLGSRDVLLDELYKDLRRSKQKSLSFYHSPVPSSATCPLAPAPKDERSLPRLACRHNLLTRLQLISSEYRLDHPDEPDQDLRWHSLLRLLYIYALLNPTLGYIQGMDEIAFVLLYVFGHVPPAHLESEEDDMEAALCSSEHAEADAFWCFSTLLGDIRDLYIFDGLDRVVAGFSSAPLPVLGTGVLQSGSMTAALRSFSYRLHWLDIELWQALRASHLDVQLPYFSFRWLACLLSTELSLPSVFRIWDMIFAEQGLSDPAVSGCTLSAKVDLLIDVCCALLVSIRGILIEAATQHPEDADGEAGAFGRLLSLLQHYPEGDLAPALELALLYRQRRMSAPLTGDHPKYDTDLTLESGTSALRKRAAGLYQAWRPQRAASASLRPDHEGYVQTAAAAGASAATAGAKALRGYTHAFQSSDTAAQLSKIQTNLAAKAMEGWSARRPSAPPANSPSEVTSPMSETGWLGRSRAALNAASESFRSVSGSLTSPATSREAAPEMQTAPRVSPLEPDGPSEGEAAATPLESPAAAKEELYRPEPAKRALSATELLRAKYIDNVPPGLPPRPPPLPKRNLGTPPRSTPVAVGKASPSPGVRRMTSTSSGEVDRSESGVERAPSSSSKAESIAISVSSYDAPTVAAGRFFNRKRETSLGTNTLPTATPPSGPRSVSVQSEDMLGVKEEDKGSISSASPPFATPIGSDEHLPRLSEIPQPAPSLQSSSNAPTTTVRTRVRTHGRFSSDQPRMFEEETVRSHRISDAPRPADAKPLPLKPRQKHVKALSVADAIARYADDQSSPRSFASRSSGRELLASPISPSGEAPISSPVPDTQAPDGKVRYTLTDGPNPTSTIVASPTVSPATSLRRTELNQEGKRRVASRRVLSVSEGRAAQVPDARGGRVASLSGKAPPPSSFRSHSPPGPGATGLLKRTSRVHSRRGSQASEFQIPVSTHVPHLPHVRSPSYATNGVGETKGVSGPPLSHSTHTSWPSHPAGTLYGDPHSHNFTEVVQSPTDTSAEEPLPWTGAAHLSVPPAGSQASQPAAGAGRASSTGEMYSLDLEYDPELVSDALRQQAMLQQLDAASLYD